MIQLLKKSHDDSFDKNMSSSTRSLYFSASVIALIAVAAWTTSSRTASKKIAAVDEKTTSDISSTPEDRLKKWKDRWAQGKTNWHKKKVHPSLAKFVRRILPEGATQKYRVLVPLCGKTVDMAYLASQPQVDIVVGIDGAPQALEEFANENLQLNLQPVSDTLWSGESINCVCGDFFEIATHQAKDNGRFDVSWDRAALVAINPALRQNYVEVLGNILAPGGRILLSTYVRTNGDILTGPPFSIDEGTVRQLFEPLPWVEKVELLDSHWGGKYEEWYKIPFLYWRLGNIVEKIFLIHVKK